MAVYLIDGIPYVVRTCSDCGHPCLEEQGTVSHYCLDCVSGEHEDDLHQAKIRVKEREMKAQREASRSEWERRRRVTMANSDRIKSESGQRDPGEKIRALEEHHNEVVEALRQQLATVTAERDEARAEVKALQRVLRRLRADGACGDDRNWAAWELDESTKRMGG